MARTSPLDVFSPATREWFTRAFAAPTEAQAQAWPAIASGELAERLGDRLGEIRPAVQPGRRIATLQPTDGVSARLAFMSQEPP